MREQEIFHAAEYRKGPENAFIEDHCLGQLCACSCRLKKLIVIAVNIQVHDFGSLQAHRKRSPSPSAHRAS